MKAKINIYNLFTVIFAILTVISLGSIGSSSMHTVITNTVLFAMLTLFCYEKENALRAAVKKRRQRKVCLAVYRTEKVRRAA